MWKRSGNRNIYERESDTLKRWSSRCLHVLRDGSLVGGEKDIRRRFRWSHDTLPISDVGPVSLRADASRPWAVPTSNNQDTNQQQTREVREERTFSKSAWVNQELQQSMGRRFLRMLHGERYRYGHRRRVRYIVIFDRDVDTWLVCGARNHYFNFFLLKVKGWGVSMVLIREGGRK